MKTIGSDAFTSCSNLTEFEVDDNNENFTDIDGVIFNKALTEIILVPNGKNGAYTIPNTVTKIGERAFYNCVGLTNINIPKSVTLIEENAFSYCYNLKSIDIPKGVTEIGDNTFSDCTKLENITFANSVTTLGNELFKNSNSLKNVYYIGTTEEWNAVTVGSKNTEMDGKVTILSPDNHSIVTAQTNTTKTTAKIIVPTAGDYVLVFADYNENALNSVKTVMLTVTEAETGDILNKSADIVLGTGDKIMLWNSLSQMKPLCNSYNIN